MSSAYEADGSLYDEPCRCDQPGVECVSSVHCQHPHPDQPRTRTWCKLDAGHGGEHRSGAWSWHTQGIPWPGETGVVVNRWSPDYFAAGNVEQLAQRGDAHGRRARAYLRWQPGGRA